MPIPRRYTTDAIVLSRFDFGEADRILTLITPGFGKLKVIAKGIRRPTSRIGGSLEPFAELTVALARGRTFEVVTQVSVGHAWLNLRDSLESAATAWYLAELAAVGYVHLPAVAITLAGGACAAQLAVVSAGRYAPYPPAGERPARGPLRAAVRTIVLTVRARRHREGARRRATG